MNYNKYTKAELISKIHKFKIDRLKSRSFFNKILSYLSQFWIIIIGFKNVIVKITLISYFIQLKTKHK